MCVSEQDVTNRLTREEIEELRRLEKECRENPSIGVQATFRITYTEKLRNKALVLLDMAERSIEMEKDYMNGYVAGVRSKLEEKEEG